MKRSSPTFSGGVAQVQVTDDDVEDAFPEEEPDSAPPQPAQAQPSTQPNKQQSTATFIPDDSKNLTVVSSIESPSPAEVLYTPRTSTFGNLRAWCGLAVVGSVIGLLARS